MSHPIKRFLRSMAWQRAKGELYSILETYCANEETNSSNAQNEENKYREMKVAIDDFVERVEANGLQE